MAVTEWAGGLAVRRGVGKRSVEQLDESGCGIATLEKATARSLAPEKGIALFFLRSGLTSGA
jgi:hypothetical protein